MTRRAAIGWRVVAAGLVLACAACLVASSHDGATRSAVEGPGAADGDRTRASSAATAGEPTGGIAVPAPVGLRIAAIGVSTGLLRLGLQTDGTVEVPDADPARAGWYDLGTRPGAAGSAVILGHVDSVQGPAVFARLDQLVRGDLVQVTGAGGTRLDFEVRTVQTYPNVDFPARRVYARGGVARLNLVTCGGSYDAARGGYQANVVVYTRLVGPAGG